MPDQTKKTSQFEECTVCHRLKKPIGRDSRDNGLCDHDCIGYYKTPHPGFDWPELPGGTDD